MSTLFHLKYPSDREAYETVTQLRAAQGCEGIQITQCGSTVEVQFENPLLDLISGAFTRTTWLFHRIGKWLSAPSNDDLAPSGR